MTDADFSAHGAARLRPKPRLRGPFQRTSLKRIAVATTAIAALLGVGLLSPGNATPASAAVDLSQYPTWEDVQAAKNNESLKATEVANIQGLISTLQVNVETTQQASIDAGDAYYAANQEFLVQEFKATELQTAADNEKVTAEDANVKVGQVASQLYRSGGDDTALKLLFAEDGSEADDLLNQLGQMDLLMERNQTIYETAFSANQTAQSLSDQAQVARDERDRLKTIAEEKWVEAQDAAIAAADALSAQQSNLITLEAQLEALQDETTNVTTQYEIGVEEKRKAEEEAERQRIAEAQRRAEEAAAAAAAAQAERDRIAAEEAANRPAPVDPAPPAPPAPPEESAGGGSQQGSNGWTRPSWGERTSGYGPRYAQCGANYCASGFHEGVDLASGCGSGIYAAQSGWVNYAGYNGGYGNYIRIDHGGGIATGYGHIQQGGILVSNGQWVNAGDMIALEGNTGNSFGCHVHFEVYSWGSTTNPIDFMAGVGVWV